MAVFMLVGCSGGSSDGGAKSDAPKAQTAKKIVVNGFECVDLGLSVKWATCNVGAKSPEEYGDYYAWGEVNTKDSYTQSNSATLRKDMGDIAGKARYDVARANLGEPWRMPTQAEFEELMDEDNCTWNWTVQGDVKGYKVTSKKNGNSIFLPAAGTREGVALTGIKKFGTYLSSTPNLDYSSVAYALKIENGNYVVSSAIERQIGCSVRPVTEYTDVKDMPKENVVKYAIGDYYNDGVKEGIVFDVDEDGVHGKIVSVLDGGQLQWASNRTCADYTGAQSEYDGLYNTCVVMNIRNWKKEYPAFAWCASLGDSWYLPAIAEVEMIYKNKSAVNKALKKIGKKTLAGNYYSLWSSTETDRFSAMHLYFDDGGDVDHPKFNEFRVRAVSNF